MKRKWMFRTPPWGGLIIPGVMISIAALALAAPCLADEGTVGFGDDGMVGGNEHEQAIDEIDQPLARAIYSAGDVYCHQKEGRSLTLNGNQMPVCARDIGVFTGMILGGLFAAVYRGRFSVPISAALIIPMALDGGIQMVTSYESINPIRIFTGYLGGFAIAWMGNCAIMYVSGDYPPR
jgi:uncharacterized membrane protein